MPARSTVEKKPNFEIRTLKEFGEIRNEGEGYIIITDTANPNKIHTVDCRTVTRESFVEKVIVNECRNGHYYWTDDIKQARYFNAVPCSFCKPTIPRRYGG